MDDTLQLLQQSPFFEEIRPGYLEQLAKLAQREHVEAETRMVEENAHAEHLYMLIAGRVQLTFEEEAEPDSDTSQQIFVRTISEPGRIFGWSAVVEPYHYRATATALEACEVLVFERQALEDMAREDPDFGSQLMERVLWVLGNRLRESRIRLVARRYEQEVLAIRALLAQSAEQLPVTSPLLKIPFYLENRLTLADAFQTLELLQFHGDELERNLAHLCLDILDNVRKELVLYQQLQAIYEHVANAPVSASPAEVRSRCCEEFKGLFDRVRYVVRGRENLPDKPGHIFIMNHLDNHPDNQLPNDFRLTLDTHFVSCMLLKEKYGESPIRIIRKSKPDEFAHQRYYDRLGYIYVFAGHVDEDVENPQLLAEQRRRLFLDAARSYLLDGKNIIICPEGACTNTEQSPLPFKTGAFRLALHVKPEPLVIPIAVANFDKKITRSTISAVVHKPFRVSEHVPDPYNGNAFHEFMDELTEQFRGYVREAVDLAEQKNRGEEEGSTARS